MSEIFKLSEYIIGWGVLTMVGVLNIAIYFLLAFSDHVNGQKYIIYKLKYVFLTKALAAFTLALMPLLIYAKAYDLKRIFETTSTILYTAIVLQLMYFTSHLVRFLQVKKKK